MLKSFIAALALLTLAACDSSSTAGDGTSSAANASAGTQASTPGSAGADSFYNGKNLTYIVATDPGGGYDAYARMIGKHMEEYLGVDNVIIRNVPGAGHIVGTNTLWKSRPDGLTIGTFNAGLIYGQLVGTRTQQFDLAKFEWIGKAAADPRAVLVSKECDIRNMEDLMAAGKPVKFSSAGIGSASYVDAMLLAEAFNLNIDVVTGFNGTEGEMAMMRGEVCAQLGSASSLEGFVKSGYGSFILTIGGKIDGVPQASEFARDDRAQKIVALIDAIAQLGRVTAAPPGTPGDRVEALRAAYKASLENPALLAEAEKADRPIEPAFGEDVKKLVVAALDQTPATVKIIARAIHGDPSTADGAGGRAGKAGATAAIPSRTNTGTYDKLAFR
jgi:tripartite-type tricarboxylate transporter receptor subunit TctC